jgi:hypothetical protein
LKLFLTAFLILVWFEECGSDDKYVIFRKKVTKRKRKLKKKSGDLKVQDTIMI